MKLFIVTSSKNRNLLDTYSKVIYSENCTDNSNILIIKCAKNSNTLVTIIVTCTIIVTILHSCQNLRKKPLDSI